MIKKLKLIFKKIIHLIKNVFSLHFYLIPIQKNKIVCSNFIGKGYGGNPKYLVEELLKLKKYKIIWFVKEKDNNMPREIKQIKYNSLLHYYHMITARLWVDNIRNNPKPLFKRKNQFYLQTWHGGFPYKSVEADSIGDLSKEYINAAKKDSKLIDFMLSGSQKETEIMKKSFWYEGNIIQFGIPGQDPLVCPNVKKVEMLKEKYGIQNKKICLYAPTFRNESNFYNKINFEPSKLLNSIKTKFGDDFILAIRLHPNDVDSALKDSVDMIDLSKESDSQLVLSATDIVISDYSSMMTDFMCTLKPTFCFAPDYDEYVKRHRNLYFDIEKIGIPFSKNFCDLIYDIENFNENDYKLNVQKFIKENDIKIRGNSAERVVKYLIDRNVL